MIYGKLSFGKSAGWDTAWTACLWCLEGIPLELSSDVSNLDMMQLNLKQRKNIFDYQRGLGLFSLLGLRIKLLL